jgi:predicted amidophosphoribosyltransferase
MAAKKTEAKKPAAKPAPKAPPTITCGDCGAKWPPATPKCPNCGYEL